MDQEFIRLMQILLGNHGSTITGYGSAINTHVANLNRCLSQNFIGNYACPPNPSSPVIAPVVFSSSGEEPVFAVFGLNPLFDVQNNSICKEKSLAGNTLSDYAAFYNSKSCNTSGVFPFVFNPLGSYYRNIFKILYSLCQGGFEKWDSIFPRRSRKLIVAATYLKLIKDCPIIVAELIPFHSKRTAVNINALYACNATYRTYHQELFNTLNLRLAKNGVLFSHGQAASTALRQILGSSLIIIKSTPAYDIAKWNGRYVIILNQFMNIANGLINGDDDIKALIDDIISLGITLPCKCDNNQ